MSALGRQSFLVEIFIHCQWQKQSKKTNCDELNTNTCNRKRNSYASLSAMNC